MGFSEKEGNMAQRPTGTEYRESLKKVKVLHLGTVRFPAFRYCVRITVASDMSEYLTRTGTDSCDRCAPEAMHRCMDGESEIIFRPFPSAGTVAHESWHAIRAMLLEAGCELDNENVAYHLGFLVDQIHEKVSSPTNKFGGLEREYQRKY